MNSDEFIYEAANESDTQRLGAALADQLPAGANVSLIGTLGAGKTRLVQAIAAQLGVPAGDVTSPTFVLVNQYRGRAPLIHVDAYRLRDEDEFLELGPEEFFESDALVFVEWADRIAELMPSDRFEIRIESTGEQSRRFSIVATAPQRRSTLDRLGKQLATD